MSLQIKETDLPGTVDVTISFLTEKGKPATVDGVPTWAVSDPAIVDSLTPSADGMSAKLHITDARGASQLTVNADVDMGAGTKNIDFVDTISVIAGEAVSANFAFGAVTPDAATPPAAMAPSYPDEAAFTAARTAYTGPEAIRLDGIEVKGGTAPPLDYWTHAVTGTPPGEINTTSPTD